MMTSPSHAAGVDMRRGCLLQVAILPGAKARIPRPRLRREICRGVKEPPPGRNALALKKAQAARPIPVRTSPPSHFAVPPSSPNTLLSS